MSSTPKQPRDGSQHGVLAVLAMLVCCAAPALLASVLFASIGSFARSPTAIAVGIAIAGVGAVFALRRHPGGHPGSPDAKRGASGPHDI